MEHHDLLLLHGAMGASTQFQPLLPLLDNHFKVHSLDFEGHGTSPLKDRPFRFSNFAENVIEYLDEYTLGAIDIFGHSLGGAIGLYLARSFPDRVRRVFTLGTKFQWSPKIAEKENLLLNPDKMKAKVPHFVKTLQQRHTAADWNVLLEKLREQQTHIGAYNPLGDEAMRQITHRIRIGIGDRDNMVSLDESIRAYGLLPNGELHVLPATSHPLEKVSMQRLASAIIDFFT